MKVDPYIQAKSDQLNADDLIGGPIVVTIDRVSRGTPDQPVVIHIGKDRQPWRPCKTALRTLVMAWGTSDTTEWIGRQVELYRDPSVQWGGVPVGGIRVSAVSHIDRDQTLMVTAGRGKKEAVKVRRLAPALDLHALLDQHGVKIAALDAWCKSKGKPRASEMDAAGQAKVATWLAGQPDLIAELAGDAP